MIQHKLYCYLTNVLITTEYVFEITNIYYDLIKRLILMIICVGYNTYTQTEVTN